MKRFFTFTTALGQQATRTPGLFAMVTGLAFGFYFATASTSSAQQTCQVCHKGKRTLNLPCQSSAVERHIAHGDTAGPCPATQAAKPETKTKAVAARKVAAPTTAARVQRSVE